MFEHSYAPCTALEEAKYADIIIHVVDVSNPRMDEQMYVVYDTLRQMGAEGKPVITLFNKQDRLEKDRTGAGQTEGSIAGDHPTGSDLCGTSVSFCRCR